MKQTPHPRPQHHGSLLLCGGTLAQRVDEKVGTGHCDQTPEKTRKRSWAFTSTGV